MCGAMAALNGRVGVVGLDGVPDARPLGIAVGGLAAASFRLPVNASVFRSTIVRAALDMFPPLEALKQVLQHHALNPVHLLVCELDELAQDCDVGAVRHALAHHGHEQAEDGPAEETVLTMARASTGAIPRTGSGPCRGTYGVTSRRLPVLPRRPRLWSLPPIRSCCCWLSSSLISFYSSPAKGLPVSLGPGSLRACLLARDVTPRGIRGLGRAR